MVSITTNLTWFVIN